MATHWFVNVDELTNPATGDQMLLVSRWFTGAMVCMHYKPQGGEYRCLSPREIASWVDISAILDAQEG